MPNHSQSPLKGRKHNQLVTNNNKQFYFHLLVQQNYLGLDSIEKLKLLNMKILMILGFIAVVHGFVAPLSLTRRSVSPTTTSVWTAEPDVHHEATTKPSLNREFCLPLEEVSLKDLPRVGGKTASLGEMIQTLQPLGVDVPGGFAVTADAYDAVLDRFQLRERLSLLLDGMDGT